MCFRVYNLLSKEQAESMKQELLKLEWTQGLAKTASLTEKVKNNSEILPTLQNASGAYSQMIQQELNNNVNLGVEILPTTISVPKFNRYSSKGTYKWHYDASPMGPIDMRTDYSCTLALTDSSEYEGGDLEIDINGHIIKAPRLEQGQCVVYESGQLHRVTPVTKGERISAICWIRSLVKDPQQRQILTTLTRVLNECEDKQQPIESGSEAYTKLTGIQTILSRMWLDA